MTLQTLLLLQQLLHSQRINVAAPDDEIQAVLLAKLELAKAVLTAQEDAAT